jgi:glycosyltransferase involved in cell wall biosynthesis
VIAILRPVNIGSTKNYQSIHRAARGDYVASIDGDDYALPGKLARQVAVLDASPDCSSVFHSLKVIRSDGSDTGNLWPQFAPERIDADYLFVHHPVFGHSSMMYRRVLLQEFLNESGDKLDFTVYAHLVLRGDILFLNQVLGAYRMGVGISRQPYKFIGVILDAFDYAQSKGANPAVLDRGRANQLYYAAYSAFQHRDYEIFRDLIAKSMARGKASNRQLIYYLLRGNIGLIQASVKIARVARRLTNMKASQRRQM